MMKFLPLLALLSLPVTAQEPPKDQDREVRIYFLDFAEPRRALQDVTASIVIETRSGAATTVLVPLSTAGHAGSSPAPLGAIRGLTGTPYFVELEIPGLPPSEWRPAAEGSPRSPERSKLSARQVLSRAHAGPRFSKVLPSTFFKEPFTATITFRLGDETAISEEFQHPSQPPAQAAAQALELFKSIGKQTEAGKPYTDVKPASENLLKELDQLAPAGFQDDSGALERNRQWCLSTARAIEDACDRANPGLILNFSTQALPQMNQIVTALAPPKGSP